MPTSESLSKWSDFWFDLVRRLPSDLSHEVKYSECHRRLLLWRELLSKIPQRSAKFCNFLKTHQLEHHYDWIRYCHYVQLQSPACVHLLKDPHAIIPDSKAGEHTLPEWKWLAETLPQIRKCCFTLADSLEREAQKQKVSSRAQRRKPKAPKGKLIETVSEKLSDWQVRMLQQRVDVSEPEEEDLGPDPFERVDFEDFILDEDQQPLTVCTEPKTIYSHPVLLVGKLSNFLEDALEIYEPAPFISGYYRLRKAHIFCSTTNSWDETSKDAPPNATLFLVPKYSNRRWYWLVLPRNVPISSIRDWSPLVPTKLKEGHPYEPRT